MKGFIWYVFCEKSESCSKGGPKGRCPVDGALCQLVGLATTSGAKDKPWLKIFIHKISPVKSRPSKHNI